MPTYIPYQGGLYEDQGDGTMTGADPLVQEAPPGRIVARVPLPPRDGYGSTWVAIEAATSGEAGEKAAAWDRGVDPA
jgi:hypothetical protein